MWHAIEYQTQQTQNTGQQFQEPIKHISSNMDFNET